MISVVENGAPTLRFMRRFLDCTYLTETEIDRLWFAFFADVPKVLFHVGRIPKAEFHRFYNLIKAFGIRRLLDPDWVDTREKEVR